MKKLSTLLYDWYHEQYWHSDLYFFNYCKGLSIRESRKYEGYIGLHFEDGSSLFFKDNPQKSFLA